MVCLGDTIKMFVLVGGGHLGSYELVNNPPHIINCLVKRKEGRTFFKALEEHSLAC